MKPTEIDLFAGVVRHVIGTDGLEGLRPIVFFTARCEVRILDHLPAEEDGEEAALHWVAANGTPGDEFLVAFRTGPATFGVVRHAGPIREEALFNVSREGDSGG